MQRSEWRRPALTTPSRIGCQRADRWRTHQFARSTRKTRGRVTSLLPDRSRKNKVIEPTTNACEFYSTRCVAPSTIGRLTRAGEDQAENLRSRPHVNRRMAGAPNSLGTPDASSQGHRRSRNRADDDTLHDVRVTPDVGSRYTSVERHWC